ncbi:MAG: OadG family protein [Bacteroidales bacterium]|nr:OadG family protein [Bacteroidales bacterium]
MILLATNWADAWTMTGIGVGVVFCILCILVLVLMVFNLVAKKAASSDQPVKAGIADIPVKPLAEASELDKAAVATALYLYEKSKGDQESGVLTIKMNPSPWHAVLNERL